VFHSITEIFGEIQRVLDCSRVFQRVLENVPFLSISERFGEIQRVLDCSRVFQSVPESSGVFQGVLQRSLEFCGVPWSFR